jgi:hypothetical protein
MGKQDLKLILKIFVFSMAISIVVKYGGSQLFFEPSSSYAIVAIFLPALIILFLLFTKNFKSGSL